MKTSIERVENGYIVTYGVANRVRICLSTQELFEFLLMELEGRCKSFSGGSFGKVVIEYDKPATPNTGAGE